MIDDYRLMELFFPICKRLDIFSQGFMHGRISDKLQFQSDTASSLDSIVSVLEIT